MLASSCLAPGLLQAEENALPGGATEINERYGDWSAVCRLVQKDKQDVARRCGMSQQQVNAQGKRVLAIQLQPGSDGATGSLILPFGLDLAKGIELAVDDAVVIEAVPFKTCLPEGCVSELVLGFETIGVLRGGGELRLGTYSRDGKKIDFSISLNGFADAFNRVGILLR